MEKFKLKTDLGLTLTNATRLLGTVFFGFFLGTIFTIYNLGGQLEWTTLLPAILCSLALALFPGVRRNECLTLDEDGIIFFNYHLFGGTENKIVWDKINAIRVHTNTIEVKDDLGSSMHMRLPIHTKKKRDQLKHYLKQLTNNRSLEYLQ